MSTFDDEFEEFLKVLSTWQGNYEETASLIAQLCELERVSKAQGLADLDHELLQKASHVFHQLLCQHIPGLMLAGDDSSINKLLEILEYTWKLLFCMYDQAVIQVSEPCIAGLIKSLLLLLKSCDVKTLNKISLTVMKRSLEWLQCIQKFNPGRINKEEVVTCLQPYLNFSVDNVLRLKALMVIHGSIKSISPDMHSLLVLTAEDIEFLKSQIIHPTTFSSIDILELLLSLSHLSQNLEVMILKNLLDTLSFIFEKDENLDEQETAAQLVQIIIEYKESKNELTKKAIESGDHVKAAKAIRSSMCKESASNQSSLTFQVSSLEELVFLTGYDVAVCVGQAEDPGSPLTNEQRSLRIHQSLTTLCQVIAQAGSAGVHRIMSVPYCLDTLCLLIRQHWIHLPKDQEKCSLPLCNLLLDLASQLVMSLTDVSQLAQETVVQWGLILLLTLALDVFRKESDISVLQQRITCSLLILQNCSPEAECHHVFETIADTMIKCLAPYTKSHNCSISFDAKVVLLLIAPFLKNYDLKHLLFTQTEMSHLLSSLMSAINSKKLAVCLYDSTCSVGEVIVWLEKAAFSDNNIELMIDNNILTLFPMLLKDEHQDTVIKGAKLLWTIASKGKFKKLICQQCPDIVDVLKISKSPCPKILSYVFHCIHFYDAGPNDLLKYAYGCYEHYRYQECLLGCDKLLEYKSIEQSVRYQVQAVRCKALFKIYQNEYSLLLREQDSLSARELHEREKSCHDKLREVIGFFGAALDKNSIDDEGLMCLDYAMIDFIRSANELNKLRRCMLCLKQKHDIKRSHIVPKSTLEVFRSGFVQHQGNKGLILAGMQPLKGQVYHTEKTITKFMLCGDCEALLSKHGEQDFITKFFMKIYDASTSGALMMGQKLPYEGWFYHFCVGFLFRGIAGFVGIPNVMNNHEVYNFFKQCREFLLKAKATLPKVYVFVNPSKVPREHERQWVNEALLEPAFFDLPSSIRLNGNDCHYPEAHFFVAHLGILNVLVAFSPANEVSMPEQFVVNPNSSVYLLPSEELRLKFLPEGVKAVFTRISDSIKEDMKEFLFRREKHFPPVADKTTDKALEDTVGLVEAINADFEALMKSNSINILPQSFHIDRATKKFQLPPEYQLLVHATFPVEAVMSNFTYFIGLVDSHQPFVIVYQQSVSETKCFGCLISEKDLSVKKYIGGIPLTVHPEIVQQFDSVTTTFCDILPIILSTKGFKNMKMLIQYRAEEAIVMDTKCPPTIGCWFCEEACVNCMEMSAPGFSSTTADGLKLQFCSDKCMEDFIGEDIPLQVNAVLMKPPSGAIECQGEKHRPIISISAFARSGGKVTKFSLKIYQKNSSMPPTEYCAHYCIRQLFSQQFSKFLISSEAEILNTLVCLNPKSFAASSQYWIVEEHLLQATKTLFKCHGKFMTMNYSFDCMTVYLDCLQKFASKLKDATRVELVEHLVVSIASYKIVSSVSQDWVVTQTALLLACMDTFKKAIKSDLSESFEHVLGSLISLPIELLAEMCTTTLYQDLKFTVVLLACELAFTLLSRDLKLVDTHKDELRNMWTVLLDFVQSQQSSDGESCDMGDAIVKSVRKLLDICVQQQWMLEIASTVNTFNYLEPLLIRVDHLRWLSLVILYLLFPWLSKRHKKLMLFSQSDIKYMILDLNNASSISVTVQVLQCAVSMIHNVRVLFESGVLEVLADLLDNQSVSQGDQENITMLIEKIVGTDVTTSGANSQDSSVISEINQQNSFNKKVALPLFIQQLKDLFSNPANQSLQKVYADWKMVDTTYSESDQQELLQVLLMLIEQYTMTDLKGNTAIVCLVLTILQEILEEIQYEALKPEIVAEIMYPLLKKGNSTLRIQTFYTATFLCRKGSLQECFKMEACCFTKEDVYTLLSFKGHLSQVLRLIEHFTFSTDICKTLLENGAIEFFKNALGNETNFKYRITFLIEKIVKSCSV